MYIAICKLKYKWVSRNATNLTKKYNSYRSWSWSLGGNSWRRDDTIIVTVIQSKVQSCSHTFIARCFTIPKNQREGITHKNINFYQEMASEHRLQESVSTLVPLSQNTWNFDAIQIMNYPAWPNQNLHYCMYNILY